jgi:hypothetical protein
MMSTNCPPTARPFTYNDALHHAVRAVELWPLPGDLHGRGFGVGFGVEWSRGLAMGCGLIVAAEDVTFDLTPTRLCVHYNYEIQAPATSPSNDSLQTTPNPPPRGLRQPEFQRTRRHNDGVRRIAFNREDRETV